MVIYYKMRKKNYFYILSFEYLIEELLAIFSGPLIKHGIQVVTLSTYPLVAPLCTRDRLVCN